MYGKRLITHIVLPWRKAFFSLSYFVFFYSLYIFFVFFFVFFIVFEVDPEGH